MNKKKEVAHCAVDYAFKRIGGKYKGRILWVIRDECLRYGELKRAIIGVTPKMLTQVLRELEEDELVLRKVYKDDPPKVEYHLTKTGKELIPLIRQLRSWGEKQMSQE